MIDVRAILREFQTIRPAGGFPVLLSDPPWDYRNWSSKGDGKGAKNHYDCLPIEEIARLPVEALAAKNAALFLWCTWPMAMEWRTVIEAWGFKFSGLAWEWIKFNPETGRYAFGPGYGTRKNLEPCLLCTRGNPPLRDRGPGTFWGVNEIPDGIHSIRDFIEWNPQDCIRSPLREHSRKPDEQYDRIETLFGGPYCELFSRSERARWHSWGNDTGRWAA